MEEKNFEELFMESVKNERRLNKIETGKVIEITSNGEIFVDLGYKADGIIPKKEFSDNEDANPNDEFKVGDSITVEVKKLNDGVGNVLLSYKNIRAKKEKEIFAKKVELGEIFEGAIKSIDEKGIVTELFGTRIFIPMSLSGIRRNDNLEEHIGEKITFKITEFNQETNKIIGSHKVIEDEKRQKAENDLWNNIQVGMEYKGIVKTINSYGVFVDLNGVQGLLHISEITWKKNVDLNNYFKVGQEIEVFVKELDKENRKIALGFNEKEMSPWENILERYNVNDIVKATVTKFMTYGAFVKLEEGIEGLVHISEISEERILKPEQALELGQIVDVKILDIDTENRKLRLSIKAAHTDDWKEDIKNVDGVTYNQ